jgi:hypothetical protein
MNDVKEWLEQALPASELPPLAETRELIAAELRATGAGALDGPARRRLDEVMALGRDYFEPALARGDHSVQDLDVPIPPVLIQGDKFITFKGGPRNSTFGDPGAWLEESHRSHTCSPLTMCLGACKKSRNSKRGTGRGRGIGF